MNKKLAYPVLTAAVLLALAGCSSGSTAPSPATNPAASAAPTTMGMDMGSSMTASPSMGSSMTPSSSAGAASSMADMIHIKDFNYESPASVAAGSTVTVMNMDSAAHTVTADDGSFDVTIKPGETATFKAPAKPGSYAYHCTFHANMHGTLVVK